MIITDKLSHVSHPLEIRLFHKSAPFAYEKRSFLFLTMDTAWCVFRYGLALTDYLNFEIYNESTAIISESNYRELKEILEMFE